MCEGDASEWRTRSTRNALVEGSPTVEKRLKVGSAAMIQASITLSTGMQSPAAFGDRIDVHKLHGVFIKFPALSGILLVPG